MCTHPSVARHQVGTPPQHGKLEHAKRVFSTALMEEEKQDGTQDGTVRLIEYCQESREEGQYGCRGHHPSDSFPTALTEEEMQDGVESGTVRLIECGQKRREDGQYGCPGHHPSFSSALMEEEKQDGAQNGAAKQIEICQKSSEEGQYGCRGHHPRFLQFLNNIKAHVFFQCVFNFFEGFIVNGVINVSIAALETRYRLSSTKSALIASANDFGTLPVLPFIGYLCETRSKPRVMAAGIFLMALGSLMFALPQFIVDKYTFTKTVGDDNSTDNLCWSDRNNVTCLAGKEEATPSVYPLFLFGQILLGMGAAPMFTIGLTYVDENTQPKMVSMYTGFIFTSAAVGVAAGYTVGGQTMALFVDVDKLDPASIPLTIEDPKWVGAWWIGILIAMSAFLLVGFPVLGYPRHMPGYNDLRRNRASEVHQGVELEVRGSFGKSIKDFPKSILILVRNPAYDFLCLGGTIDALVVAGTATFGAKILQQFFHVDLSMAGWIMGAITIFGAGGGMLLGGWLVKRWSLKCQGIMRLCLFFTLISLLFSPSFFAICPKTPLAGINQAYISASWGNSSGIDNDCNRECNCDTQGMEPICYNGSLVFFSPCHAGCKSVHTVNNTQDYINCSCLGLSDDSTSREKSSAQGDVISGSCAKRCDWLYVFCVLFFGIMVCTFATMSPNVTAVIKCVPFELRSQALGFQILFIRLLGTIPGPVLFGSLLDSTCLVWQESSCEGRGLCWVYDQSAMGLRIMGWWIGLKLCGACAYCLASFLYKPPSTL